MEKEKELLAWLVDSSDAALDTLEKAREQGAMVRAEAYMERAITLASVIGEVCRVFGIPKDPAVPIHKSARQLINPNERVATSNMVMQILIENTHIVDGQVRGVIVHGAVEKLTDIIMDLKSKSKEHEQ